MSGRQFGPYTLEARLGRGGMAETWRAKRLGSAGISKQVAIKRILPGYSEDEQFIAMFVSEAKVVANLSHGNIAQVFDVGQVDGEYYIAMEFVDGPSLKAVLEKAVEANPGSGMPVPLALYVIVELCKALHHAHTARDDAGKPLGIVHRDISPENVMLSWQGQLKIIDFGIAHSALPERPKTEAGIMKGKVQYMSPEQARAMDVDSLSDVWAAGIVLFEMLCGRPPVDGSSYESLMALWRGDGPKPSEVNPALGTELDRLVGKALAVSKTDRFRSAQHLLDAAADMLHRDYPGVSQAWLSAYLTELYADYLKAEKRVVDVPMSARAALRSALAGKSAQQRRTLSKDQVPKLDATLLELDSVPATSQQRVRSGKATKHTIDETSGPTPQRPLSSPKPPRPSMPGGGSRSGREAQLKVPPENSDKTEALPVLKVAASTAPHGATAARTIVHEDNSGDETAVSFASSGDEDAGLGPAKSEAGDTDEKGRTLSAPARRPDATRAEGVRGLSTTGDEDEADDAEDEAEGRASQADDSGSSGDDEGGDADDADEHLERSVVANTADVPGRERRRDADRTSGKRPAARPAARGPELPPESARLLVKVGVALVAVILVGVAVALLLL